MAARITVGGGTQPSVIVDGVVKRFGDTVAVVGVDLAVWPGEIVALLGPNGAGKTTTLEMCEGFIAPDRGMVRILGLDPLADRDRLRPRVGVMLQGGGGYPGIRAGEMLHLAASCAAHPLDARRLLDTLGLTDVARTKYRRLSGGQRRRLSLACALVGRPDVVFLDEPTEGLDPAGRRLVWQLVRRVRDDGVAVLLTTHAIDEAETLADHVTIMDRGRVIADGCPADVSNRDTGEQVRFRAPRALDLDGLRAALENRYAVDEYLPGSYRVRGPISPAVIEAVTTWGAAAGILLSEVHVSQGSLEDAFLTLTRPASRAG